MSRGESRYCSEADFVFRCFPWICCVVIPPRALKPSPNRVFSLSNVLLLFDSSPKKALMWLFRAETIFFPCFFLPPPPPLGQARVPDSASTPTSVKYPLEATTFVMWGLTFGVISDLAVAGGGRAFAYQGPPYFR